MYINRSLPSPRSHSMVDTIKMVVPQESFIVKQRMDVMPEIQKATDDYYVNGNMLYELDSQFYYGNKAFINTEFFNATTSNIKLRDGDVKRYLSIQYNPAKVIDGHNNHTILSKDKLMMGIRFAEKKIDDYFEIDYDNVKIKRVDIGAGLEMQNKPAIYLQYLKGLNHSARLRFVEYETAIYFRNQSNQIIFYDKTEEAKKFKYVLDQNILRIEGRELKAGYQYNEFMNTMENHIENFIAKIKNFALGNKKKVKMDMNKIFSAVIKTNRYWRKEVERIAFLYLVNQTYSITEVDDLMQFLKDIGASRDAVRRLTRDIKSFQEDDGDYLREELEEKLKGIEWN